MNSPYILHLANLTRLKSALWVFGGGVVASVLVTLSQTNILSLTWLDLKIAVATAVVSQITKAFMNYVDNVQVPE